MMAHASSTSSECVSTVAPLVGRSVNGGREAGLVREGWRHELGGLVCWARGVWS